MVERVERLEVSIDIERGKLISVLMTITSEGASTQSTLALTYTFEIAGVSTFTPYPTANGLMMWNSVSIIHG